MSDKKNLFKTIGTFPAASGSGKSKNLYKDITDPEKFTERRKKLTGITKENKTDKFLKRRLTLTGGPKLSKALDVAKQVGKRTLVGKIVDTGVKVGAGAAAGYEYAKEKFKKPKKKSEGGFMIGKGEDYIKDLL